MHGSTEMTTRNKAAIVAILLAMLAGGCITVRNEGSGSVIVTKTITSDASIPASMLP